jgi:hypothetical protein
MSRQIDTIEQGRISCRAVTGQVVFLLSMVTGIYITVMHVQILPPRPSFINDIDIIYRCRYTIPLIAPFKMLQMFFVCSGENAMADAKVKMTPIDV